MSASSSDIARLRTLFIVESVVAANSRGYRYICGSCGAPLMHQATLEPLDCVFACRLCRTVNDAPFEAKGA